MGNDLTRRTVLAGLFSTAAAAALAEAPLTSIRPRARPAPRPPGPARVPPVARVELDELIRATGPGGTVSLHLADLADGRTIVSREGGAGMPPASVTKAVTTLYALGILGPDHRFVTRLVATGPVTNGVLDGDLALVGGGDPTLSTDDLATLAADLKAAGVSRVTGDFLVYGDALPYEDEIDDSQLDHLGYNPSVSGLNLNFNRVHFQWARAGSDYEITLDARTAQHRPNVTIATMNVADRTLPIYEYADGGEVDTWSVARRALGDGGSRWLPVRRPALYAGDVFRTMARSQGIMLRAAARVREEPVGATLARHDSAPLEDIARDMLRYSTNLTAEVLGLSATAALSGRPADLPASARAMNDWLAERYGVEAGFVDHSGLGDASRISAEDMVRLLGAPGARETLIPVLKVHELKDPTGAPMPRYPASVAAKTGTLNFVSTLAGYIRTAEGRDLAFAIFCGDLDRRELAKLSDDETPDGASYYNGRAKNLQQKLLQRWGLTYADYVAAEAGLAQGG